MKYIVYKYTPGCIFILILLTLPLWVSESYWQRVICLAGIYALLAISFDFLASFLGIVSLGSALFVGAGGYISGLLNIAGLPIFLSIPLATALGAIFCTLLLLPSLSLRGTYFAVLSLIYPLMIQRIIEAMHLVGGTDGITGIESFHNFTIELYIILPAIIIIIFLLKWLINTDYGTVLQAIKDNEPSVHASGINVIHYKTLALLIASAIGSFSGAYLTHIYGWVGLSLFGLDFSIIPITAYVIGGPASLAGPAIGALLLVPLSEALRDFGTLRIVFYSIVLIVFILLRPDGLLNFLQKQYKRLEVLIRK